MQRGQALHLVSKCPELFLRPLKQQSILLPLSFCTDKGAGLWSCNTSQNKPPHSLPTHPASPSSRPRTHMSEHTTLEIDR